MNVLIVDDDKLARKGLVAIMDVGLEMTGVCPSGERAWQVAEIGRAHV